MFTIRDEVSMEKQQSPNKEIHAAKDKRKSAHKYLCASQSNNYRKYVFGFFCHCSRYKRPPTIAAYAIVAAATFSTC